MNENLFNRFWSSFLFCAAAMAQLNVEFRFTNTPTSCSTLPCSLRFCIGQLPNCSNEQRVEFEGVSKTSSFSLPFEGQPFNVTFSLQVVIDSPKQRTQKRNATEWSVRLTKQWQPLFGDFAEARLKCSENFYGPFCQTHCVPRNPHQECDQETGQRRCLEGYRGVDCTEPVDCSRRCVHGKCSLSGECVCFLGYEGKDCRIRASTCNALKPCMNGGTCHNLKQGAYECQCPPGYDGPQCERRMITCAHDNPCRNGAECQQDFGRPLSCKCPPNYHGQFCQVWAKNCSSLPCQNDAHCVSISGEFGCVCKQGFIGKICDQKQQKCTLNTCGQNRGTCVENPESVNGIECQCRPGYFGAYCEMVMVDCRTSPCLNNGICQMNTSAYQCQCPRGYTGNFCEITIKTMELNTSGPAFAWIICLLLAMLCLALLIVGCLGVIHLRYRRLSLCLDSLLASIGAQRQQPPRIRPPPTPLLHSQHFSSDQFLLKKADDVDPTSMEMKAGGIRREPRVLSADALCQRKNFYVEEPIRPVNGYSSVDTLFERYATVGRTNSRTKAALAFLPSRSTERHATKESSRTDQTTILVEGKEEEYAEISEK